MAATLFRVNVVTEKDEVVCVAGNTPLLGDWLPEGGIQLERNMDNEGESHTWSRVIDLPAYADIKYRFFVCRFLGDGSGPLKTVVLRWESNRLPRKLSTKNGQQEMEVAEFGNYGGRKIISQGWLNGTTHVQLRLHANPIYMWKSRHRQQTYRVKCIPRDHYIGASSNSSLTAVEQLGADEDESKDGLPFCNKTIISCYSLKDELTRPTAQDQYGHVYRDDDYLVFELQTTALEHLGYELNFYVDEPNHIPRYIGHTYLLPLDDRMSFSRRKIPISGLGGKPIGEVSVEFFITKPYTGHRMDMSLSYRNYWKRIGRSLDVGHRGMGESYKKLALARENTLASLSSAGTHGADMVEFDVMLSKDLLPIVYHDYSVSLMYRQRWHEKEDLVEIPVKDLTCEQLQSLRLYHASSSAEDQIRLTGDTSDSEDLQPFPTLQECLERVPQEIGFNIEIKYPLETEDGWEMENYFDHNLQVDCILDTVFKHAADRRIIFASFDPETCLSLQLKQNKYPVLFLINGPTKRYAPYLDYRTRGFGTAINFALATGLLGVDFQSEGLLQDLSVIQKTRDAGLVLFVWGADNNSTENLEILRQHGVDGLIYDRIDFYKKGKGKQFVLDDDSNSNLFDELVS